MHFCRWQSQQSAPQGAPLGRLDEAISSHLEIRNFFEEWFGKATTKTQDSSPHGNATAQPMCPSPNGPSFGTRGGCHVGDAAL